MVVVVSSLAAVVDATGVDGVAGVVASGVVVSAGGFFFFLRRFFSFFSPVSSAEESSALSSASCNKKKKLKRCYDLSLVRKGGLTKFVFYSIYNLIVNYSH